LIPYLIEAANVDDVRVFNRDRLRLIELADSKVEDIWEKEKERRRMNCGRIEDCYGKIVNRIDDMSLEIVYVCLLLLLGLLTWIYLIRGREYLWENI